MKTKLEAKLEASWMVIHDVKRFLLKNTLCLPSGFTSCSEIFIAAASLKCTASTAAFFDCYKLVVLRLYQEVLGKKFF